MELQIISKNKFLSVLYYMGVKYAKIVLGTGRDGQFAQIIVKFWKIDQPHWAQDAFQEILHPQV